MRIADLDAGAAALAGSDDLFTSPAWLAVIRETYGFPIHVASAPSGAALPFAALDDIAGRRLIVLPFSDYAAPPADAAAARPLLDLAADRFPRHAQRILSTYDDAAGWIAAGWEGGEEGVVHRVPLGAEEDTWRGFTQGFRNQVRQGQRQGVRVVREDSARALDRFYAMHATLRNAKYASIPQPRRFFAAIHRNFLSPGQGFVLRALAGRKTAVACVVLAHGNALYYKFSTSRAELSHTRATNVMLWELLRLGAAEGFATVDLGRAGLGESYRGLRHFKEGLGASPAPIFAYRRPARIADPAEEGRAAEARKLVADAARLIARAAPLLEANDTAGETLYRYFA